jgi:hypothetical protein
MRGGRVRMRGIRKKRREEGRKEGENKERVKKWKKKSVEREIYESAKSNTIT